MNQPSLFPIQTTGDWLARSLVRWPEAMAFAIHRKSWVEWTFKQHTLLAIRLAKSLKDEYGFNAGSKIAIVLGSCPELSILFFAASLNRWTCVLIDPKLTASEIGQILVHSDSELVVADQASLSRVTGGLIASKLELPVAGIEKLNLQTTDLSPELEKELSQVALQGQGYQANDLALIIYTSGTTGSPKGALISWQNLCFNSQAAGSIMDLSSSRQFLSILPLNHLFEFTTGFLTPYYNGFSVCYANSILPTEVVGRLQDYQFTDMVVVPLFLRFLMKGLVQKIELNFWTRIYFRTAMAISKRIPYFGFRRILFYPVLKKIGFLKTLLGGGAPLENHLQCFFENLGIEVYLGYGLTETSPVTAANGTGNVKVGSVGRALPGTELRIDPITREIQVRGPHVMVGYFKEPELTRKTIDAEGWFATGDTGYQDEDGFVFITGRIKEIVVLGSGKKVYPDEVELQIASSLMFKDSCVLGIKESEGPYAGQEIVCLVVQPADEKFPKGLGLDFVQSSVEDEVRRCLKTLADFKRPQKVVVTHQDLPKTSTRKNKRFLIKKLIEEGTLQ